MNYLKTAMLIAALTALFMGVGYLIGGQSGMSTAFIFALGMNFLTYWFSDKIVLSMYRAQEIKSGAPKEIVRELARNAGIPEPRVYMIDTPQPNAFATGRSPANAAVAVTKGITEILNYNELRGVIAHELAHIKNRDTLTMTITATIAGALSMLANFAFLFGGRRDRGAGPIATILVMILAPIAAMLVQMAISRTREYAADRIGAGICRDPLSLASALEKLDYSVRRVDNLAAERNPATAHLFIVNPLHMRKSDNLFATHPNMQNRINALKEMVREPEMQQSLYIRNVPRDGGHRGPWG